MVEIKHISLAQAAQGISPAPDTIYIFEDRWRSCRTLMEKRIRAHQGIFRSIYARKCTVFKIDSASARSFLELNHVYGNARSHYRYALSYEGEIVAVATFSKSRPITRIVEGMPRIVQSYEWVRAACLPDCRIAGGMGKLLEAFVEDVHPQDIMAYADLEWSEGKVYEKLGFSRVAEIPPVEFYVDPITYRRFPLNKLGRDRALEDASVPKGAWIIKNLGSVKYVKTYEPLCRPSPGSDIP